MQKRQPKGIPVGGQFAQNQHDEAVSSLETRLQNQTPVEIDSKLSDLMDREFSLLLERERASKSLETYSNPDHWIGESQRKELTDNYREKIERLDAELSGIKAERNVLDREFSRRGGWTRAFLVTGSNGHVHKNMQCSTCFPTTRYYWVTDMSGHDESEIVEAAGEKACTVCYPSAPVDVLSRPSKIEDPAVVEERRKREEAKAKRDAERETKGITDPVTGGDLIVRRYHIKTAITAEREAVDALTEVKHDSISPYNNRSYVEERKKDIGLFVAALANKRGESKEETFAYLEEKARKKFKKDSKWLLDEHGLKESPATEADPSWL